ncbi:MAG TPA: hypothetical protein VH306_10090 [Gaiellaceae bacterium]
MRAHRPRTGIGAALLFAAAAVGSVANELARFGSHFLSTGLPGYGEAATGDHLQTIYGFWLVGDGLEHGRAPWIDPYSFQPLIDPRTVFGGWPFGFPFWPLEAAFGSVIAWNVLLLLLTAGAGLATYAWLRALDLPVAAALVGGLAFELAPYRLVQSGGHLLGWAAVFLPVALWAIERSRDSIYPRAARSWGFLAAAALVSIPLSGQIHLALGAIPFVLAYAAVRFRRIPFAWALAGTFAAVGAGILVYAVSIRGSTESGGRSLAEVERYQASWADLVDRSRDAGLERFVDIGWLVPLLALAGVVVLARRRPWLAVLLALSAIVPLLLALGTHTPVYEAFRTIFPPLRYPRVPGRLMPIADLALAGLAAFAVAAVVRRLEGAAAVAAACLLAVLVAADLTVWPLRASAADPDNRAYAALGPGRILELPIMGKGRGQFGSVYLYYATQNARERPTGYAVAPPRVQQTFAARFAHLNCGIWRPGDRAALLRLGIRSILLHRGLYDLLGESRAIEPAAEGLQRNGFDPVTTGGRITLFGLGPPLRPIPPTAIRPPVRCRTD